MIRINQLKLPITHTDEDLQIRAAKLLRIPDRQIKALHLVKQSIDARKKDNICYSYVLDVETERENEVVKSCKNSNISISREPCYHFPSPGKNKLEHPPVIVGSGPAGLFCGLMLARYGYCPIILERGNSVRERTKCVEKFWQTGKLDTQCNVQFGEGGAGTFSDGKLNTLVKDPKGRNRLVLSILAEFGADSSICYVNKPHLGTDKLSSIVEAVRKEIIRLGGQVRFLAEATDFLIRGEKIFGIIVNGREELLSEAVVLAIGHSARDTFFTLHSRGVPMDSKSFAVGLRIQHPQKMIDDIQYGSEAARILGPASYKLTHQCQNGRGVYSFCMCPGGFVVNASSEEGRLAVNGMSYHARDTENANSALIVTVTPKDFGREGALAGIDFQRRLEEKAFWAGRGKIPLQLYKDFKANCCSCAYGKIKPQIKGEGQLSNLRETVPEEISSSLIEGIEQFGKIIPGFNREDAILAGIESRTSSPVRIMRSEAMESSVKGLFPCGEGAGYAGGITSAAMDGIRAAEEIARRYLPIADRKED